MKRSLLILISILSFNAWSDIVLHNAKLQLSPYERAVDVQVPNLRSTDFALIEEEECTNNHLSVSYLPFQNNTVKIGTETFNIIEGVKYNSHIIDTVDCQLNESSFKSIHLKLRHSLYPKYMVGIKIDLENKELSLHRIGLSIENLGLGTFEL